jgi:hypothetical protein
MTNAPNRRRPGDSQFVEAPPDVRPAEGEFDVTALGERTVAGVAVDLKDALKSSQMRARPLGLAIRSVHIGDARQESSLLPKKQRKAMNYN